MRSRVIGLLAVAVLLSAAADPYRLALPGYKYDFPRDYFSHPEYQTEWWYYTGNLHASDGRKFGFELTFFRQGLSREMRPTNVWDMQDVWLAHLALSDIDGGHFFHSERLNRSGAGIAGADQAQRRVWNGNWQVRWTDRGERLEAVSDRVEFDLTARSEKPLVIHGIDGISQKSEGIGKASHYFSETRLRTSGTVVIDGRKYLVDGLAWMDHEFFTHQLTSNQSGWDWFSLQFDDGSELMLYRLRLKDGTADPYSSGTYVDAQGRTKHLRRDDFALTPGKLWTKYPIAWTIRIPSLSLEMSVATRLPQQELTGTNKASPTYWEGAIEVVGSKQGNAVKGVGYLEMTGYAGPVNFGG